jgi:hypothetical protein
MKYAVIKKDCLILNYSKELAEVLTASEESAPDFDTSS